MMRGEIVLKNPVEVIREELIDRVGPEIMFGFEIKMISADPINHFKVLFRR